MVPYFAKNAADLEAEVKPWNWPVRVYSGAEASETQLRAIHSPRILHFSTHGFFLPRTMAGPARFHFRLDDQIQWQRPQVVLKNPMHRSGVALAGAQVTLDAWKRGETPPTDSDGILTAEEVGDLDLHGTWLVVLVACDTGVGEAGCRGRRVGIAPRICSGRRAKLVDDALAGVRCPQRQTDVGFLFNSASRQQPIRSSGQGPTRLAGKTSREKRITACRGHGRGVHRHFTGGDAVIWCSRSMAAERAGCGSGQISSALNSLSTGQVLPCSQRGLYPCSFVPIRGSIDFGPRPYLVSHYQIR